MFDRNLTVLSNNSDNASVEGFNVLIATIDEVDQFRTDKDLIPRGTTFRAQHSATRLDNTLASSAQSRFPGVGKTVLMSYLRRNDGYILEQYDAAEGLPSSYRVMATTCLLYTSPSPRD